MSWSGWIYTDVGQHELHGTVMQGVQNTCVPFKEALYKTVWPGWLQVMWLMLWKQRLKSKHIFRGRKLPWSLRYYFSCKHSSSIIVRENVIPSWCPAHVNIQMCCHKSDHFPQTPRATWGPSLVMQIDVWWWTVLYRDSCVLLYPFLFSLYVAG